jgi:class III poly(R)-hydroxyalkanoic acid synthase PhaE subunit
LPGSRRLQQEFHAGLAVAAARCERAAQHFNELVAMIAADACEKLVTAIWGPDSSGPPVTSLRELRDLWVECGEQAYAQAAHREDFAAALAESLAAAVELCFEQRRLAEAWSRTLDLPTRSEVDAISERLHLLHRRVLELERGRARHGKPRR